MSEPTTPPDDPPGDDTPEDLTMTERIYANGKALVWQLYEASATRHISLQRRDRGARKLALLLNPPRVSDEMDACAVIAGGIFAERAACVAAVRAVKAGLVGDELGKVGDILDVAVTALLARGPVTVAAEWESASTELFVAGKADDAAAPANVPTTPPTAKKKRR